MTATLNRPTLVLNRVWQPVGVARVARALMMCWNGTARIVDPDDFRQHDWADWARLEPRPGERAIVGFGRSIRLPEVVTLSRYDRVPTTAVTFSRRNVHKRDHATCQYCGVQPGSAELTIDHVTPRSRGGASSWDNCVLACVECNRRKADRTPAEAGMRLRRKPARPAWRPVYATRGVRVESWSKFLSEAYWNVPLEE